MYTVAHPFRFDLVDNLNSLHAGVACGDMLATVC